MDCTLSKFADTQIAGRAVDRPDGRATIQEDLGWQKPHEVQENQMQSLIICYL